MRKKNKGQVLTEYVMLLAMFAMIGMMLFVLLSAFLYYGWRVTALIGWEP